MYYTSEEENYRKYGIVILEVYDETLRTTVYHYRKPTPSERKEIILNYIVKNSGTPIKVGYLSSKLAVSDRTIQKIIKELTSDLLYDISNPYGFRDWDWGEFKLHSDLELEERINQFEILRDHKEELNTPQKRFLNSGRE